MTDPAPACYRDRTNGVRYQRGIHHAACADDACRGCRPCPERWHCTARRSCSWHVEVGQLTCGRCLARVRADLRWIGDLASLLPVAAEAAGVDSEAANLAGPATDSEAWSWRKAAAMAGGSWHLSLVEDDDEHHPLRVTQTWARMIAEDYGHEPDLGTVASCVGYLDRQLSRIAHDDEQDFPLLGTELRVCRDHVEVSLRNGDQIDRGAPCPECTSEETGVGPRLVREWAATVSETWDEWRCPRNRAHRWSHEDYVRWIETRQTERGA